MILDIIKAIYNYIIDKISMVIIKIKNILVKQKQIKIKDTTSMGWSIKKTRHMKNRKIITTDNSNVASGSTEDVSTVRYTESKNTINIDIIQYQK